MCGVNIKREAKEKYTTLVTETDVSETLLIIHYFELTEDAPSVSSDKSPSMVLCVWLAAVFKLIGYLVAICSGNTFLFFF